ncbi:MAG TPA: hypothetical protein VEQ85_13070, partial [Lacipirellulaceae bacterium]|nr:hypothetical protein [Lacipirellulaceae bacterium]
ISPPSNPEMYQEPEEAPRVKPRPLTRNQVALRTKVRNVLKYYYNNPLNTADRSPWEVMHCMLSFEVHSRILKGGPEGEPITTVGWLCFNQPCKGRTLMYLNQDGNLRVKVGPALQGHHGQLLALLAQARVRTDYPMRVEGKDFTVADLIEEEKATCYPRTELTFKLLGLQRYLDINATWMNDQGMQWDFPTLLREEMRQPVRTAACGGTHRLSGLALTVKKRQRSGLPVDGEYAAAQKFVANYVNYAYRLQNKDGSFSTEWFKGPGSEEDIDRRLKTTGHQLEFLIYSSPDEQLGNQRLVRGVNYLSNIMWANRGRDWEAGPLGHAIHALVLYDRLVFAPHDQTPGTPNAVAQKPRAPQQRQGARRARRSGARRGCAAGSAPRPRRPQAARGVGGPRGHGQRICIERSARVVYIPRSSPHRAAALRRNSGRRGQYGRNRATPRRVVGGAPVRDRSGAPGTVSGRDAPAVRHGLPA